MFADTTRFFSRTCAQLYLSSAPRFHFFRKLGVKELLVIAYRDTVASSGVTAVAGKPLGRRGSTGKPHEGAELDIKGWHKLVVRKYEAKRLFYFGFLKWRHFV